jgi:hypothetical protein|tara:strand:+ start:89 stop:292 length:204 start_codon:yes stop_codon:yes gene_type:complete
MTIKLICKKFDIDIRYGKWYDNEKNSWIVYIDYYKSGGDGALCSIGWIWEYGWKYILKIRGIKFLKN